MVDLPTITAKDLFKVYRSGRSEVIALRGLDMQVAAGDMVAIKGPSGCGKTTLLNLIGGIDRPTAGRIEVGSLNLGDLSDIDLIRYRREQVGIVFQFFNLVPTLSAQENVELPMRLAGKALSYRRSRSGELLRAVDLANRASHQPDELSGGEQQRIAIATALANDPPLLLADEPTGELDSKTGQQVLNLLHRLNTNLGKTVLIVTHDQRVASIADRVLEIQDGKVLE